MNSDILLWTIITIAVIAALFVPAIIIFRRLRRAAEREEKRQTTELETEAVEGHLTTREREAIENEQQRAGGERPLTDPGQPRRDETDR